MKDYKNVVVSETHSTIQFALYIVGSLLCVYAPMAILFLF